MSEDRRRAARVHTVHLVSYAKFTPERLPELLALGSTVELSEGGLRLTTRDALVPGEVLHLEFELEGDVVKTDARVVHVEEVKHYHIGFAFEGISGEEREKIRRFLEKHGWRTATKEKE